VKLTDRLKLESGPSVHDTITDKEGRYAGVITGFSGYTFVTNKGSKGHTAELHWEPLVKSWIWDGVRNNKDIADDDNNVVGQY